MPRRNVSKRTERAQATVTQLEHALLLWLARHEGQPLSELLRADGIGALLHRARRALAEPGIVVPGHICKLMADAETGTAA